MQTANFNTFVFFVLIQHFQCYMRALFDYDPEEDTLLPCKTIGLPFQYGDILQVSIENVTFFVVFPILIQRKTIFYFTWL